MSQEESRLVRLIPVYKRDVMKIEENIIGYDIRAIAENGKTTAQVIRGFPGVKLPRSYDYDVWPSRFRSPLLSEYPADPKKTNFRNPHYVSVDGKFPVYPEYAERYNNTKLWENMGNMLLRYTFDTTKDVIVAFSLFKFDSPIIYTYDYVNYGGKVNIFDSVDWKVFCEYYKEIITPKHIIKKQWIFKGYEVSNGESILMYEDDIFKRLFVRVNEFGLMTSLDDAIRICEAYNDEVRNHGAYLIYGIYEAISADELILI